MTTRSVRAGALAATALAAFYALVIGWASDLDHLGSQARADWYYVVPILAGFGTQVALLVELRHRRRARHLEQNAAAAGAGASAFGMVACCAHHLADLAPIIGASAAAAFLTDHRVELMATGIAINAAGVVVAAHRLRQDSRSNIVGAAQWHAA